MADGRVVTYLRVSTDRQGASGLGLEAQRESVANYLNGGDWELLEEFVEVESGKQDHRPKLHEALRLCRATGATLVIAKLDRLSRSARFLFELQEAGIRFVAADMPEANTMTVGVMAVVAQHEREQISKRTKEALQAAKGRGTKLGNPNGAEHLKGRGNKEAVEALKGRAEERAENLRPYVEELRERGVTSVRGIAQGLNERGIRTPRGREWGPSSVKSLLDRLAF